MAECYEKNKLQDVGLANFHHLFSSLASTLIVANLYSLNNKSLNLIENCIKFVLAITGKR